MLRYSIIMLFVFCSLSVLAQETLEGQVQKLWPNGTPDAIGQEEADTPELTLYLPPQDQATGAAVLICPGGGYGHLAMGHEGHDIATWLNHHGIAGIILKYRIAPRYHHPAPSQDAFRAMRTIRANAKNWNIHPQKIGIIGFSAGGHLASTVATHFDSGNPSSDDPIEQMSSRPDFVFLLYPVVTMKLDYTHRGSRRNLLGDNPDANLIKAYSNETQITIDTPPTFLAHTVADSGVKVENSLQFFQALRKNGVPAELHFFEQGRHGLGLAPDDPAFSIWPDLAIQWLYKRGILTN